MRGARRTRICNSRSRFRLRHQDPPLRGRGDSRDDLRLFRRGHQRHRFARHTERVLARPHKASAGREQGCHDRRGRQKRHVVARTRCWSARRGARPVAARGTYERRQGRGLQQGSRAVRNGEGVSAIHLARAPDAAQPQTGRRRRPDRIQPQPNACRHSDGP